MKMTKRNYFILLVLALIFAAPGITAYLYYLNPQWLTAATTNKGTLLTPPVLFSEIAQGKPKWRLVYWYPENCEAACLQEADKLARVRLALGRHLYEVDEWLVLAEQNQQVQGAIASSLKETDIHVLSLAKALPILDEKPKVFIANPKGYLVLAYGDDAKPQDIFHDIKQLLNTTEKKSD
ncbi:hypothetical protein BN59_01796 [Legionella massiliensis]|uniref:Thioredoxin domain-containing protein n=1 Tax=Legionella massiliensis TaxID=1034943 RepID=A0A078L0I7_9GAMM|nr:hypothetical protein [Legionella massiliensis]CDZ77513.1 hypothetical protein BN59_01796 [Legionella massiliensis]CEE13251.1 hypothetical protein BN1094_01796 [Legionella massiliensis]